MNALEERAAIRRGLWTCIDAMSARGNVSPTEEMIDLVLEVQNTDLPLLDALVLGVFITNAAEQQMTAAVELSTEAEPTPPTPSADVNENAEGLAGLVGHYVTGVFLSPDDETLYLRTGDIGDTPVLAIQVDGDCCSRSWWHDVMQIKQLLGERVTRTEAIDMPEVPREDMIEEDLDYGLRIWTERGACTLVYRNTSNGYYGGMHYATWRSDVPAEARQLLEDYSG